jgi:hypothetical protein
MASCALALIQSGCAQHAQHALDSATTTTTEPRAGNAAANSSHAGANAAGRAGYGSAGSGKPASVAASAGAGAGGPPPAPQAGHSAASAAGRGDDADAGGPANAAPFTAFRITQMFLRDPHIFFGPVDFTDVPVLGISVNTWLIPSRISMDADNDGFLDVSVLALLQPSVAGGPLTTLKLVDANCTPDSNQPCVPSANPGLAASWTIENRTTGHCLEPIPNSTSNYKPPMTVPAAPCFLTSTDSNLVVNLGGMTIAFAAARVSATYRGDPPEQLVDGLIAGFVTNTAATRAVLPPDLGSAAGTPISDYIVKADRDLSTSPTGEDGFWMYLNFVATPITLAPGFKP